MNTMLKEFDKLDQFIFDYVPLPQKAHQQNKEPETPKKLPTQDSRDQGVFRSLNEVSTSFKMILADDNKKRFTTGYKEIGKAYKGCIETFSDFIKLEANENFEQ